MIHRPITAAELTDKILVEVPKWKNYKASKGKHWNKTKPVLLDWQHYKCAYCESLVGGRFDKRLGARVLHRQDVEHYRPKARTKSWHQPPAWVDAPVIRNPSPKGYPWLRHHERNYLISCKDCNASRFKGCYFPVFNNLDYATTPDIDVLAGEQPLLIFPLSELEGDPTTLICFLGWEAHPFPLIPGQELAYWRARVSIELLGLNREDLVEERKDLIAQLGYRWVTYPRTDKDWADHVFEDYLLPKRPFLSCVSSYLKLCLSDPAQALRLALEAHETTTSKALIESLWK